MAGRSPRRAIYIGLNLLAVTVLGIEVWKQELIPPVRWQHQLNGSAVCDGGKTTWQLERTGPNPDSLISPWFRIVSFVLPRITPADDCLMILEVPGLLHLNAVNYYVKHLSVFDKTELSNDNLDSGVLLGVAGAYQYRNDQLIIPARSLRELKGKGPTRIELLANTSIQERLAFFRDALKVFLSRERRLVSFTSLTLLLVAVRLLRERRRRQPALADEHSGETIRVR